MFWNWEKAKINRERILAFDLLRGTFLIEIIANHIAWSPSLITFIGGGGRLPASAAEGFFMISGVLVGYLYGPKVLKSTKSIFYKIWKRAALLYVLAVFFTLLYTAWAVLEPGSEKYSTIYQGDPVGFLVDTFTLRYAFGWADFLTRYAVFMLTAPFAVWLAAKGRAWIVVLLSFIIWFFLRDIEYFLPFSAWQIVFMLGIVTGYYLPYIENWFRKLSQKRQRLIASTICMPAITTYILSIIAFVILPTLHPHSTDISNFGYQISQYFDKTQLAPARIAIGTLWFAALYILFRRFEKPISKYTLGVLEVFGRQSLFVYCFHAFILFYIDIYLAPPPMHTKLSNTIVTIAVLAIIYTTAYYRHHLTRFGKKILSNKSTTQIP